MDDETADTLQQGGFYLYALRAVETSSVQGEPVIWRQGNSDSNQSE